MTTYVMILTPSKNIDGAELLVWKGKSPNPLEIGDTVMVIAHFGTYTSDGVAVPLVDYYGLSLGTCFPSDTSSMETSLDNQGYRGLLINITKSSKPGTNDFFCSAVQMPEPVERGGETKELTTMVEMTFNPGANRIKEINAATNKEIDIVADYGDPHKGCKKIPVRV
jgi:hypothetical protein